MNSTASSLAPSSFSEAEFHQAELYIEQTRDGLLGATRLLTPAQWEFQPAPDRWSVAANAPSSFHVEPGQENMS